MESILFTWKRKIMEKEILYNDRIKKTIETYSVAAKAYQDKFMDMDLYNDTFLLPILPPRRM
jgi:hypothetical protein